MKMPIVRIDARRIVDSDSFHDVFAEAFGFPDFYGRNMDAWIDCLTSLDVPSDGLTAIHTQPGGVVTLQIENMDDFAERCPPLYEDLIDCAEEHFAHRHHQRLAIFRLDLGRHLALSRPGKYRIWVEHDKFDNLRSIGRSGQFWYNNMARSMRAGIETAQAILGGPSA